MAGEALVEGAQVEIRDGSTVHFEFTLTLLDGTVVESNVGQDPLCYEHGDNEVFQALQDALAGAGVGDQVQVQLTPSQAFGETDPDAFKEVPLAEIPQDARAIGTQLTTPDYEGPITVHEIRDDVIVLDLNHPLAGEILNFDIHILSIE